MICPKCGTQNMDGVSFCGSCGSQLLSYTPVTPVEPQQNVSYSQQQQYQQTQQPPLYGSGSSGSSNYGANVFPSGSPTAGNVFPPKNYLTESIIVTVIFFLCCCWSPISFVLGILAIIKANNVNSEFAKGNKMAAINNAESAKKLLIWAVIVGIAFIVIGIIFYIVYFAAIIAEMGGWQDYLNSFS